MEVDAKAEKGRKLWEKRRKRTEQGASSAPRSESPFILDTTEESKGSISSSSLTSTRQLIIQTATITTTTQEQVRYDQEDLDETNQFTPFKPRVEFPHRLTAFPSTPLHEQSQIPPSPFVIRNLTRKQVPIFSFLNDSIFLVLFVSSSSLFSLLFSPS